MFNQALTKQLTMIYDKRPLPSYVVVEDIRRPFFFEIETSTEDTPGRAGHTYRRQNYGKRTIEVDLRIIVDSMPNQYENREKVRALTKSLRAYFFKDRPRPLVLSDQPSTYDMAIPESFDIHQAGVSALITVHFLVPEGFSRAGNAAITNFPEAGSSIFYTGDLETPLDIQGTATGASVRVQNLTSGERIDLLRLTPGKLIQIDGEKECVRQGDLLAMTSLAAGSDFPWLIKGENQIEISGLKDIEIRYEGRYL